MALKAFNAFTTFNAFNHSLFLSFLKFMSVETQPFPSPSSKRSTTYAYTKRFQSYLSSIKHKDYDIDIYYTKNKTQDVDFWNSIIVNNFPNNSPVNAVIKRGLINFSASYGSHAIKHCKYDFEIYRFFNSCSNVFNSAFTSMLNIVLFNLRITLVNSDEEIIPRFFRFGAIYDDSSSHKINRIIYSLALLILIDYRNKCSLYVGVNGLDKLIGVLKFVKRNIQSYINYITYIYDISEIIGMQNMPQLLYIADKYTNDNHENLARKCINSCEPDICKLILSTATKNNTVEESKNKIIIGVFSLVDGLIFYVKYNGL